jgi:hypothetical protein
MEGLEGSQFEAIEPADYPRRVNAAQSALSGWRTPMTSATSSIFVIAGAVMAFVASYNTDAIYIQSVGAVVMAIGGLSLAASVLLKPTRLWAHVHHGDIPTIALPMDSGKLWEQDQTFQVGEEF